MPGQPLMVVNAVGDGKRVAFNLDRVLKSDPLQPRTIPLDVITDLPLKKKLKKQKANKPCLELNAAERARFLAAFDDEPGFSRFLAETGCGLTPDGERFMMVNMVDESRNSPIVVVVNWLSG